MGSGCKRCGDRQGHAARRRDASRLLEVMPRQAAELVVDNDQTRLPAELPSFGTQKLRWLCNKKHIFWASISERRNGKECTTCNKGKQSSILEIRVFSEIKKIFPGALWRYRDTGIELDIFLPEISVGIEVDGYPWHLEKIAIDQTKSNFFSERGVTIYRLRDKRLPDIESALTFQNWGKVISVVKDFFYFLADKPQFSDFRAQLVGSAELPDFTNDLLFNQIYSTFPAPPSEQSIASLYSEVSEEFDLIANYPLRPEMFSPGSNARVWWKCKDGHRWITSVAKRTGEKTNCPDCFKSAKYKVWDVKTFVNESIKRHGADRYDYSRSVFVNSKTPIEIICPDHGSFFQAPGSHAVAGQGCPRCAGKDRATEDFISEARRVHGTRFDYSRSIYRGIREKVEIICARHGVFQQVADYHLQGQGCQKCGLRNAQSITIEGRSFVSISEACRAYGVSSASVFKRMTRTGSSAADSITAVAKAKSRVRHVSIDGKHFPSLNAAAKHFGLFSATIARRSRMTGETIEQALLHFLNKSDGGRRKGAMNSVDDTAQQSDPS